MKCDAVPAEPVKLSAHAPAVLPVQVISIPGQKDTKGHKAPAFILQSLQIGMKDVKRRQILTSKVDPCNERVNYL